MLIFKKALQECGIPQKAFVAASSRSKSQVSLALSNNVLPADFEGFAEDVSLFADDNASLMEWLTVQGLTVVDLLSPLPLQAEFKGACNRALPGFDDIARSVAEEKNQSDSDYRTGTEERLSRMVGVFVLHPAYQQTKGVTESVIRLAKCCLYLRTALQMELEPDAFKAADIEMLKILEGV